MFKLNCNCCDGIYNSFDVHFTSACDNKCGHCVDKCYDGLNLVKPDVAAIVATAVERGAGVDDILFLGGEPCLYLADLLDCVKQIKASTAMKVFVTTSVPKVCYDNQSMFFELIEAVDGINLSVQHHNELIADDIRKTTSKYDRQAFYNSLPHKEKIRINLNLVRPHLSTQEDISACLRHYDAMGFNSIKLSEIQHGADVYVSFAKLLGISMKSPYAHGCQTYLDMDSILPGFKTPVLLKRSCFLCEESLKASVQDGLKVVARMFARARNNYGVIYENGTLAKGWI